MQGADPSAASEAPAIAQAVPKGLGLAAGSTDAGGSDEAALAAAAAVQQTGSQQPSDAAVVGQQQIAPMKSPGASQDPSDPPEGPSAAQQAQQLLGSPQQISGVVGSRAEEKDADTRALEAAAQIQQATATPEPADGAAIAQPVEKGGQAGGDLPDGTSGIASDEAVLRQVGACSLTSILLHTINFMTAYIHTYIHTYILMRAYEAASSMAMSPRLCNNTHSVGQP